VKTALYLEQGKHWHLEQMESALQADRVAYFRIEVVADLEGDLWREADLK
jgi:hypothetical protein